MEYTTDADDEFLRVKLTGRQGDRAPHEVCAAVLAESRKRGRDRILRQQANEFINLVARSHAVMVRHFAGVQPALAWLRGEREA